MDFNLDTIEKDLQGVVNTGGDKSENENKSEEPAVWYGDYLAEGKSNDFESVLEEKFGTKDVISLFENQRDEISSKESNISELQQQIEDYKQNPLFQNEVLSQIGNVIKGMSGEEAMKAIGTFYKVNSMSDLEGMDLAVEYLSYKEGLDKEKANQFLNSTIFKGLEETDEVAREIALKRFNETAKQELDSLRVSYKEQKAFEPKTDNTPIVAEKMTTVLMSNVKSLNFDGIEVHLESKDIDGLIPMVKADLERKIRNGEIKSVEDLKTYRENIKAMFFYENRKELMPMLMASKKANSKQKEVNSQRSSKKVNRSSSVVDQFKALKN